MEQEECTILMERVDVQLLIGRGGCTKTIMDLEQVDVQLLMDNYWWANV